MLRVFFLRSRPAGKSSFYSGRAHALLRWGREEAGPVLQSFAFFLLHVPAAYNGRGIFGTKGLVAVHARWFHVCLFVNQQKPR